MSSSYGQLFQVPGATAFCLSAAVARLPMSMMGLGIVLALNHIYDNWTTAGTMSAAYILAVAVATPLYARLFDRFGQRRVGAIALTVQMVAMLGFAFGALMRIPIGLLFVLAVLMGLTQFSFGALVRTRWNHALQGRDEQLLNTAYAMESAIDELVFVLGPILAAFLATSVHPVSQLFVPTMAAGISGALFFSLKSTQPPVLSALTVTPDRAGAEAALADGRADALKTGALKRAKTSSALLYPGVVSIVVVFVVFNMSFTAFDVSMTATLKAMGLERFVGLQLAMFAVGSCIGAFIFGSIRLRGSNWSHMVVFLCLLTVGYIGFRLSMHNLVLLGVIEVLAGLFVSPLFATGNLIVKNIVPERSLTEGLSWLTTGGSVGTSIGSTVAGVALDSLGSQGGMMIPWIATACAVPLALLGWALARRRGKQV